MKARVTKQTDDIPRQEKRKGASLAPPPFQRKANKTGLPDQLKSGVESLSGIDMSDVKVHYNSSQPAQLNAHAYAKGNQIHIAPGQEKHLPHEAWHVVQQKQGRVKATKQLKGKVNINDDEGLEKEADVMGGKAVQNKSLSNSFLQKKDSNTVNIKLRGESVNDSAQVIQGMFYEITDSNDLIWHWGPVVEMIWRKKLNNDGQVLHNGYGVWERKIKSTGEKLSYTDFLKHQAGSIVKAAPTIALGVFILKFLESLPVVMAQEMMTNSSSSNSVSVAINQDNMALGPVVLQMVVTNASIVGMLTHYYAQQRMQHPQSVQDIHEPLQEMLGSGVVLQQAHRNATSSRSPKPTELPIEEADYGVVKAKENGGASGGGAIDNITFASGEKWGKTFLKDLDSNANSDLSTAYSTLHNEMRLKHMGVETSESKIIKPKSGGKKQIAGKGKKFQPLSQMDKSKLTSEQRADYAKLALLSPVADLHDKNVVIFDNGKLGTHDTDTSSPMFTHWHSRLIDRFKLKDNHYKTNEVGPNYASKGEAQDHLFNSEIQLKEADVVNAVKSFCALTPKQLAKQLKYYPLQGTASQKLALYSITTQQEMFREAFDNFSIPLSDTKKWEESDAHKKLGETIKKWENQNKFPYKFKVVSNGQLEVVENENFSSPEGTGKWKDKDKGSTNPELLKAVMAGHIGDANLRLHNETAINPSQIPKLMRYALPSVRSVGSANPSVEFIAKLIMHPSFAKLGSPEKNQVKNLFGTKTNSTALRQAFFPTSECSGPFKSDSFYAAGKAIVISAYNIIKNL